MPLFPSSRRAPSLRRADISIEPANIPEPGATATELLRRYRPIGTRAAGAFGKVEICLDSRLQRRVAIKRIPLDSPGRRAGAEAASAALGEARTASLLQHPNIVSVIDFSFDAGYAYLVMEYVDGMSLQEFLDGVDGHSLTYDEAADVADALVQALDFAHENGVLHLDIKPANVLIDRNGHVKLTDFGMAKLATVTGFGGARGGTIGYMPPEQLRGEAVDERADVFALATVMYEALCGTSPFRAATPAASEDLIDQGVILPGELLPDIPQNSEDALLEALAPDADLRTASVASFGDRFLAGLGHAREGRRSLARIIARLTSDEADEAPDADEQPKRSFELDPAEGYLGSRSKQARRVAAGAAAGASVAAASWSILGAAGMLDLAPRLVCALAIGTAAGVAPQLGSALLFTGFLAVVVSGTPLLPALPVVIACAALACSWWLVWGRTAIGPSTVLALSCALSCAAGDALPIAPLAVTAAGCLAHGAGAASSVALGMSLGRLAAALGHLGGLDGAQALETLADPGFLVSLIACTVAAPAMTILMDRAWKRWRHSERAHGYILSALVPLAVSILLLCLANRMEIGGVDPLRGATLAGSGAVSSIIVCISVYLFGYRREPTGV